jgi:hypothetical protein
VFDQLLAVIEAALQPRSSLVVNGALVDGGPDHYARLTGAKRLMEFTLAGRPRREKEENSFRGATIQQMQAALLAHKEKTGN